MVAQLVDTSTSEVEKVLNCFGPARQSTPDAQYALLEFPGVVLPAFEPTLAALQNMSAIGDFPFADILAPLVQSSDAPSEAAIPAYAAGPGFRYDLSPITRDGAEFFLHPDGVLDAAKELTEASSLDHGQAQAVVSALTRSLALIQGPPGTGKSYTGEAIMKVLLANKQAGKLGPVLYVTYTNHALDQGLEHQLDAGATQVIRIGSRSKSERLTPINLRSVVNNVDNTKQERMMKYKAQKTVEASSRRINLLLDRLNHASSEGSIENFLRDCKPNYFRQIFQPNEELGDGGGAWQTVGNSGGLAQWLTSEKRDEQGGDRDLEVLRSISDVSPLSRAERRRLIASWIDELVEPFQEELLMELRQYEEENKTFEMLRDELNLRVLLDANIIGITTSGLARNLSYLRRLRSKVLLVEEAGEVLEAHNLTALLPSLEHVILIGDHQQLRPKVQNYELSCENPRSQISLDISLFERLVQPTKGFARVPYSTLSVQRRMHPWISDLIRNSSYPAIVDAPRVHDYPAVPGMKQRLFWLDHAEQEDSFMDDVHSTSHTNTFEVDMVSALVHHLVSQGGYRANDIAVLTPYLGQLRNLRNALKGFSETVLDDRDIDDLAIDDVRDSDEGDAAQRPVKQAVVRRSLLQAVRLATIDNFQGEEAKVVVISLVRSNKQNRCGFLRTPNRINVALSRAQHGMYIMGNATTAGSAPMWEEVISHFKRNDKIGPDLELCCPRHPDTPLLANKPDDFVRLAPEAGCARLCDRQLRCGHFCVKKCHSGFLHRAVHCLAPCARPMDECDHLCSYECGRVCEKLCKKMVTDIDIELPCGHHVDKLPCWQYQGTTTIKCRTKVKKIVPHCKHEVTVNCPVDVTDPSFTCQTACGSILNCGHACVRRYLDCWKRDGVEIVKEDHGTCESRCERAYADCKHVCRSKCHGDEPCPPCSAPCEVQCQHGMCNKKCNEPCTPCAKGVCASRCEHAACSMPCAAPCDWVPCSKRCQKELKCGHQCPSLCGNDCPDERLCQVCASDEVKDLHADLIVMLRYGDVDLDESLCVFAKCGHVFTTESLDGAIGMVDHYSVDATTGMPEAVKCSSEPFSYKGGEGLPTLPWVALGRRALWQTHQTCCIGREHQEVRRPVERRVREADGHAVDRTNKIAGQPRRGVAPTWDHHARQEERIARCGSQAYPGSHETLWSPLEGASNDRRLHTHGDGV